jgi:ribosomal-protein-alanine N-acetyltransferase
MVDSEIELGFARVADAHALAAMSRDLIEAGLGWDYRADRIASYIRDTDAVVLVARDLARGAAQAAPRVAGFAVMHFGDARAHLVLLAVLPAYRRRGVASRLLAWLTETAQVAGVMSIHVELRAGNHAARALYRTAGFAETLRIEGYYRGRETAVRMLRLLRTRLAS